MNFLQKLRNATARFMYGRNGMDQLNRALFIVYLILWLAQSVAVGLLKSSLLNGILNAATWIVVILLFFRTFSRNLYKRREENQKWITWWWGMKNRFTGAKARHADKDHKYFTCNKCKAICRVPVGKGKIVITCPKCGNQIQAKT